MILGKEFQHNFELLLKIVNLAGEIMLKQDRTIIHVEVKDTHEHLYFGSAAAMFEDSRLKDLLKIKYQTFRTKRVSPERPYENEHVIVRKGMLNTIDHNSAE